MSSGMTSTGVLQPRTKSRVTLKTKSLFSRYIFLRKAAHISIVTSGLLAHSAGAQFFKLLR